MKKHRDKCMMNDISLVFLKCWHLNKNIKVEVGFKGKEWKSIMLFYSSYQIGFQVQ